MRESGLTVDDFDPSEWGEPPLDRDTTRWRREGDWQRTITWQLGDGYRAEHLAWYAEFLELDGHEDCCHHTWPSFRTVRQIAWYADDPL